MSTLIGRLAGKDGARFATGLILGVCLILALPGMVPNRYRLYAFVMGALYLIAVVGLNILVGQAGLISMGTGAFAMVGAYTVAMTNVHWGWPFPAGVALAVVVSTAIGVVSGFPALKLGPFAVTAVTLAYSSVMASLVLYFSGATGGGDGLPVEPSTMPLENLWYVLAGVAALVCVAGRNLIRSPLGRSMMLGKLSAPLAASLGVATLRVRLLAFSLAAGLAGLAGAFYPILNGRTTQGPFSMELSVSLLVMVILGGEGAALGPVVGTLALTLISMGLTSVFAEGGQWSLLAYGGILLVTVLLVPHGLTGLASGLAARLPLQRRPLPGGDLASLLAGHRKTETLVVRGVAKSMGGVKALAGVDLTVRPGTVHGLIGPNGSGKTTMLNCITGLIQADEGTVGLGERTLPPTPHLRARSGIARTFQTPILLDSATAVENVMYGVDAHRARSHLSYVLRLNGARAEAAAARHDAGAWLSAIGIGDLADEHAGSLPPGRRRMLEIARALATRPQVILLDEPAAGLNPGEIEELAELIEAVREAGVSVVLVEHHSELVMRVCDEITVLNRGTIIASGTPAEIQQDPAVIAAYLGQPAGTTEGSLA